MLQTRKSLITEVRGRTSKRAFEKYKPRGLFSEFYGTSDLLLPLLGKDPRGLILVSNHLIFAFWVVVYGRYDCITLKPPPAKASEKGPTLLQYVQTKQEL